VLFGQEAIAVDAYIGVKEWYNNSGPWTQWAVNGVCASLRAIGVGSNVENIPSS
jgi:hypothetical protein